MSATALQVACALLAFMGVCAGLYAAYLWWKASKLDIAPAWQLNLPSDYPETERDQLVQKNIMGWVAGLMATARASSELNRKAALWTAWSVFLSALSAAFGFFH